MIFLAMISCSSSRGFTHPHPPPPWQFITSHTKYVLEIESRETPEVTPLKFAYVNTFVFYFKKIEEARHRKSTRVRSKCKILRTLQ